MAQQIRYLKAENEIRRSKLPGRVTLDNRERNTLVKHGQKLGGKIKDVMTIVSYSTFRRWVRKMGVFIHIGSRQIWISPCTENPAGEWTTQQQRNFQMHLEDNDLKCETLMRDRDRKYVDAFDEIVRSTGGKIKLTPVRSPNLQAHVERVIQTIKHEVLNAFCIVTNEHLDGILRTTQGWYNKRRGHSERDHLPPLRDEVSFPLKPFTKDQVVCDSELGGHLISYRRAA